MTDEKELDEVSESGPSVLDTDDEGKSEDIKIHEEISRKGKKLSEDPIDKIVVKDRDDSSDDDDDEIAVAKNYSDDEFADDDDEEDGIEDEDEDVEEDDTSAQSLILRKAVKRASRASDKLRSHITGKLLFHIEDQNQNYLFDWSSTELKVEEIKGKHSKPVDCTVHLNEPDLVRIFEGKLNPQVSMLSGKVKVEGKSSFAVYFFNLLAPRSGNSF